VGKMKDGPTMLLKTKGWDFLKILTLALLRFWREGSRMAEANAA
jgi:hypothetical protein